MSGLSILVTGGAGYIGSMTAKILQRAGHRVTVFDNFSTGHRCLVRFGALEEGDLLRREDLHRTFSTNHFDAVVHFAAKSLVAESVREPGLYYRNNLCGTVNLLEAMKEHGVGRIVFSSTAATYGEPQQTPISEEHPLRPINPYGRSKLAMEWLLADSAKAFGLRYLALRYFNAAGADPEGETGEWHNPESHLIPNLLRAAHEGQSARLFGTDYPTQDGTCVRDYIHVEDLAEAHRLAVECLQADALTDAINLGCNVGTSVRQMVNLVREVTGCDLAVREEARREGDPAVLVASRDKARQLLGWKPRWDDPRSMIQHAWDVYQQQGFDVPADEKEPS